MIVTVFTHHNELSKKEYENILLYDWSNFRRYGNASNISEKEVWPVGTHDERGNVAFFIYGESNNLNCECGGFEIKELQYNKKLGKFGGEWFKDFIFDSVSGFEDWEKPIVNGNVTTYEKKYKYIWFSFCDDDRLLSTFVKNNFKKEIVNNKICYKMQLK